MCLKLLAVDSFNDFKINQVDLQLDNFYATYIAYVGLTTKLWNIHVATVSLFERL